MSELEDLGESAMHDGLAWFAPGPSGRVWAIVWQPSRSEGNMRAWPAPAGRTAYWSDAADLDTARREAVRIAGLIKASAGGSPDRG